MYTEIHRAIPVVSCYETAVYTLVNGDMHVAMTDTSKTAKIVMVISPAIGPSH